MNDQQKVWIGLIVDHTYDMQWIYVGATEEALYYDMRQNYGEIEWRDESNYEWSKRVRDIAELTVESYYVETAEPED